MANILIRDLDEKAIAKLKQRAARNNRSLQGELKYILEQVADIHDGRALAARIRRKLEGREHSDSAELLREDRER